MQQYCVNTQSRQNTEKQISRKLQWCVHVAFFLQNKPADLDITIFAFILEYLGGLNLWAWELEGWVVGVHVGVTGPLILFSQCLPLT